MAKKKQKKNSQQGQQFLSPDEFVKQRARSLAIGLCYVSRDMERAGVGHVIVSRRHTGGRVSVAFYLVDIWCVGVKDSYYRLRLEDYEFEEMIDDYIFGLRPCSYEEAHNLIYGAIDFAEEAGIAPDKSFNVTKYMLEEDTDDIPFIEYEYGCDGKHRLVTRSNLEASKYLPLLKKNLGEGNYEYILRVGPDDDEEERDEDDVKPLESLHMADLVAKKDKKTLISYAKLLGFDIDKGLSEDEVRRVYVSRILDNPFLVLSRLPMKDLKALEEMRDDPSQRPGVFVIYDSRVYIMELLGLAKSHFNDFGYYQVFIAIDFADVALPVLAESMEDPQNRLRLTVELFMEGMANLYGEVDKDDAKEQLKKHLGNEEGSLIDEMFDSVYESSLVLRVHTYTEGDLSLVMSPYAWEDGAALHRKIDRQCIGIESRRAFTYDEIVKAGGSSVPVIPNRHDEEFRTFLSDRLRLSESQVEDACFNVWHNLMHEHESLPDFKTKTAEEYFEEYVLGQVEIKLTAELRAESRKLLKEYIDGMPRWTLKGYSVEELNAKNR